MDNENMPDAGSSVPYGAVNLDRRGSPPGAPRRSPRSLLAVTCGCLAPRVAEE